MSVAEIIEEIRALSREDRDRVVEFVAREMTGETQSAKVIDRETFKEAKKFVFSNYGELMKKLAQ